jgi:hypothetical protein
MGHWSEGLVEEIAARVDPAADREQLRLIAREATRQIEMMAGRDFSNRGEASLKIYSGPLPLVDIPDMQTPTMNADHDVWPIEDLQTPGMSSILQVGRVEPLATTSVPRSTALYAAGHFVASLWAEGRLSRDYLIAWLGNAIDAEHRPEFLRLALPETNLVQIPVAAAVAPGWWFQVTRRLRWITLATPDDPRLIEPIFIPEKDAVAALVAGEPTLIIAETTSQPVAFAIKIRIWPTADFGWRRPWAPVSKAIRGHGMPTLLVDEDSTTDEIACQLLLLTYWHGYLSSDDGVLAHAVAAAYPRAVGRIRAATNQPDDQAAAALLLERLVHPGFDPARGAELTRRYVNRLARVAILEHRKMDSPGLRPWEKLGLTERAFYKLLPRFAVKVGPRYQIDETVLKTMEEYLRAHDADSRAREAALEVLLGRGFLEPAARKWLQRHSVDSVLNAHPRTPVRR